MTNRLLIQYLHNMNVKFLLVCVALIYCFDESKINVSVYIISKQTQSRQIDSREGASITFSSH